MDPFRETAFRLLVWRVFLTALVTVLLVVWSRFQLAVAFLVGANVALLISLGLIAWSELLTDERIVWTAAWRRLTPDQRPAGIGGRRWAHRDLSDTSLRFAKAGCAIAALLSAATFVFAGE
jgi:hypothetical protein